MVFSSLSIPLAGGGEVVKERVLPYFRFSLRWWFSLTWGFPLCLSPQGVSLQGYRAFLILSSPLSKVLTYGLSLPWLH